MKGTRARNTPTLVGWIAAFLVGALVFALVRHQFFFVLPSAAAVGVAATLAILLLLSSPGDAPEAQDSRVRKIVPQPEKAPDLPRQVMPTRVSKVEPVRMLYPESEPAMPEPQAPAEPVGFVLAPPAAAELAPRKKPAAPIPESGEVQTAASKGGASGPVPSRLAGPRGGKADDLKVMEGVGPALEKLLNSLGVYHFDQIAAWSDADVMTVDAAMKNFKGRIARDRWVAQARIIVAEGIPAFRERAKTNSY